MVKIRHIRDIGLSSITVSQTGGTDNITFHSIRYKGQKVYFQLSSLRVHCVSDGHIICEDNSNTYILYEQLCAHIGKLVGMNNEHVSRQGYVRLNTSNTVVYDENKRSIDKSTISECVPIKVVVSMSCVWVNSDTGQWGVALRAEQILLIA